MLSAAGEIGYYNVTVQDVIDRYGGSRSQFYRQFPSAAACYEEAYAIESKRLCEAILAAGREGEDWRTGLEAALKELGRWAWQQPELAKGLLIEAHAAGERVRQNRKEVFERLSHALDSARRETKSRHSPPPLTARLMIHVIDTALANALSKGKPEESWPGEIADLVAIYYGFS